MYVNFQYGDVPNQVFFDTSVKAFMPNAWDIVSKKSE